MDVREFITSEMHKPFEPGMTDCASTCDRWFRHVHGHSAMERYGRLVNDRAGMEAWLNERPSALARGVKDVFAANNIRSTEFPKAGDVGVIIIDNRACVALFDGVVWWSRDETGFVTADDSHRFIAWSVV